MNEARIAASLLAADIGRLEQEVEQLIDSGVDWLHVDVMDGRFVPQISFGASVAALAKRAAPDCVCDVHLMVEKPEAQLGAFLDAGADVVTFHPQSTWRVHQCIADIHSSGAKAGLALSPGTPLAAAEAMLAQLDMLLIMTVEPGFGGQALIESMIPKIAQARSLATEFDSELRLQVDGGVSVDNIQRLAQAGADTFVLGSGLLGASDRQAVYGDLCQLVEN